ncbi:nuclear transcription factor Y subunit B-6-like [Rutidosis leptorrhynchoides]|uniref:nuclear transcription factor Y subunit B-6-like n=1 Tax=Rutidosis leptorrhynchoides TaxID=125765 RepID=UPI003A992656
MERVGGFHGYHRPPIHPTSAGMQQSDMKLKLPEANNNNNNSSADDNNNECTVREQDRFMPIANVIRIMRKILPPHAKISDDAKETIQECVSEYISFVTGEANDRCQREQRKTITAEDVLWAMSKLGFDDYIEPLTVYLHRYREFDGGERGSIRGEPLIKRTSSDPGAGGPFGMHPFVPAAFHMGHHNGFFGPASIGGFLKDPTAGGPSGSAAAAAAAGFEPYAQCKE